MPDKSETISLKLPSSACDDVVLLVSNSDKLSEIAVCVSNNQTVSNPEQLVEIISQDTNIEKEILGTIIVSLLKFHTIRRDINVTPDELLIQLKDNYIRFAKSKDLENPEDKWENAKPELKKVLSIDSPFFILEKSIRLAFAHQNIMNDTQLVTDIRPVFNNDATKITKMVVTHLLMLTYFDGETQKQLHVTMDTEDIKKLKDLCIRAEQKTDVVSKAVVNPDWEISIIGGS